MYNCNYFIIVCIVYTQYTWIECNVGILTPLHLSKQTLTVPLNCTYVDSGNLNALNLAVKKSPSTVLKFSNRYGSTEQLQVKYIYVHISILYLNMQINWRCRSAVPIQLLYTHIYRKILYTGIYYIFNNLSFFSILYWL